MLSFVLGFFDVYFCLNVLSGLFVWVFFGGLGFGGGVPFLKHLCVCVCVTSRSYVIKKNEVICTDKTFTVK